MTAIFCFANHSQWDLQGETKNTVASSGGDQPEQCNAVLRAKTWRCWEYVGHPKQTHQNEEVAKMVGKRESQSLLLLLARAIRRSRLHRWFFCSAMCWKPNNVSFDTWLGRPTLEGGATSTLSKAFAYSRAPHVPRFSGTEHSLRETCRRPWYEHIWTPLLHQPKWLLKGTSVGEPWHDQAAIKLISRNSSTTQNSVLVIRWCSSMA